MNDDYKMWLAEQAGLQLIGDIEEIRVAYASTVLRALTNEGYVYFKSTMPGFAYEAALTKRLAEWFPASIPTVITVDETRGWFLMRDAGQPIRELIRADNDFSRLDGMLRSYVALQQGTPEHIETLLALGVPDRRLDKLPGLYADLLAAPSLLLVGQAEGISEDQFAMLQAFTPRVQALCDELAAYNIPQTLHHDDFNMSNALIQNGQYRFIDWAESAIAHPFFSLMLVLRYVLLVYKADAALMDHLRQTYLNCWIAYEPLDRLEQAFSIAQQLAALCRTLTWAQVVRNMPEKERAESADAPPYWLLTFMKNESLVDTD